MMVHADTSGDQIRRTLRFSGRVQGVGFRYTAQQVASSFDVGGYVRNLADGRVELVAEGRRSEMDRFQDAVERALRGHIEHVQAEEEASIGAFLSFQIKL